MQQYIQPWSCSVEDVFGHPLENLVSSYWPFGRDAFVATVSEQWIRLQLYFNFKLLLLSHLFAWISFIWRFFLFFLIFNQVHYIIFLTTIFFSPSHSFLIPTIAVGRILFGCIICCRSFTRYFAFIFVIAYITRFIIVEY